MGIIGLGVFLLGWALFVFSAAPTQTLLDSAELAAACRVLGIAHSPGYPLYVLAGKAFSVLVFWGNPAYRTNLFSVFCGAAALSFLAMSLHRWGWKASLAGAALLGSSGIFWKTVQVTEVFALLLLCAAFLWWYLIYSRSPSWIFLAFLFGLGLGNHHMLVLLFPAFFLEMATEDSGNIGWRQALWMGLFFILGFSVYLYLPLRSLREPLLDWEDPQTWGRFWALILRARYGTFQLAQGGAGTPWHVGSALAVFGKMIWKNLGWGGVGCGMLGALHLWKQGRRASSRPSGASYVPDLWDGAGASGSPELCEGGRRLLLWACLCLFFAGPFFFILSRAHSGASSEVILERFLPLPLLFAAWLAGTSVGSSRRALRWLAVLGIGLCVYGNLTPSAAPSQSSGTTEASERRDELRVPAGHPEGVSVLDASTWLEKRQDYLSRDYGKNILRMLPYGSLIFDDRADETEFSLAYLLDAARVRPDVRFVDCNAGVTRSVYGEDYYRIWGGPRLKIRQEAESRMSFSWPGPVFYASMEDWVRVPRRREGILFRIQKPGEKTSVYFPWQEVYALRFPSGNSVRERYFYGTSAELLGRYLLEQGREEQAVRLLAGWGALSDVGDAWSWIALWALQDSRYDLAVRGYRAALEREPRRADLYVNLGAAFEKRNNLLEAEKSYMQALRLEPGNADAHYNLGVIYWKRGDWPRVVKEMEETLISRPDHSQAQRFLPEALKRLNQ